MKQLKMRRCSGIEPCKDMFFVIDPNGKRVAATTRRKSDEGVGGVHMVAHLRIVAEKR